MMLYTLKGGYVYTNKQIVKTNVIVNDGKINVVVVFKLDRLSRSQKDTLYLIETNPQSFGLKTSSIKYNVSF